MLTFWINRATKNLPKKAGGYPPEGQGWAAPALRAVAPG